ncbi:DUF7013 family protein [Oenococcus oeni]|nr:hypothetical protein [Oenococcus oeni]OIK90338.1 hypothetical protein ATW81_09560 [Oenococcus oeni]OIL30467.1 hypothetical protein ATX06_09405 [Oenococcus oeni]OIL75961.1 hypothetical protein ATX34_09895 [Oenococcus oeni]OIL84842.1 hypothetical protein ATX41_11045 [Oenococcus oeni]
MYLVVMYFPVAVSKFGLTFGANQIQTQSYTVYEPTINQYNNASYIDPNGIYKIQPDIGDPIYMLGTTAIDQVTDESGNIIYNRNLFLKTAGLTALTANNWVTIVDSSTIYNSYIKELGNISGLVISCIADIPAQAIIGQQINLQMKGQTAGAGNQGSNSWNTILGSPTYTITASDLAMPIEISGAVSVDTDSGHAAYQDWNDALSQTAAIYIRSDSSATGIPVSEFKLSVGSNSGNWCVAPEDIVAVQSTTSEGVLA